MPYRTKDQNTLCLGDWNAICDRCGMKFKASDLRKTWDDLYVCKDDWESRHPSDFQGDIDYSDDPSTPWSRPDNLSDTSVTDVGGNVISTDNTVDQVGDTDKTLTVGSSHPVQEWNTDLTADRTITLDAGSEGDRWTIYRTGGGDFDLIIGSVKTTGIKSITVTEYRNGSWQLISFTTLGL
jgi:hypothetical protein